LIGLRHRVSAAYMVVTTRSQLRPEANDRRRSREACLPRSKSHMPFLQFSAAAPRLSTFTLR